MTTLVSTVVRTLSDYSEGVKDHPYITYSENHADTIESGPGGAIVLDGLNGVSEASTSGSRADHHHHGPTVMSRFYTVGNGFKKL